MSGATIMGNGQVALILDVAAISQTPAHHNRLEM
jgi:chemotaxis protein histidine kinase CheA